MIYNDYLCEDPIVGFSNLLRVSDAPRQERYRKNLVLQTHYVRESGGDNSYCMK